MEGPDPFVSFKFEVKFKFKFAAVRQCDGLEPGGSPGSGTGAFAEPDLGAAPGWSASTRTRPATVGRPSSNWISSNLSGADVRSDQDGIGACATGKGAVAGGCDSGWWRGSWN
ncbi:hypothetical protein KDL01_40540, partial [Actinospica durhamensis]